MADAARPWVGLVARDADATFVFPVVAKPAGFARYCRDAAMLALEFADGRTGRVDASPPRAWTSRASTFDNPVTSTRARSRAGRHGGVGGRRECVVDYLPDAVSSFELNEHLAEADDGGDHSAGTRGEESGENRSRARAIRTITPSTEATPTAAMPNRDAEAATTRKKRGGTVGRNAGEETSRRRCARRAGADRRVRESPAKPSDDEPRGDERASGERKRDERRDAPVEACELLRRWIGEALALDEAFEGARFDRRWNVSANASDGFGLRRERATGTDPVLARTDAGWTRR